MSDPAKPKRNRSKTSATELMESSLDHNIELVQDYNSLISLRQAAGNITPEEQALHQRIHTHLVSHLIMALGPLAGRLGAASKAQATKAGKRRVKATQDDLLLHRTAWLETRLVMAQDTARRFGEPIPTTLAPSVQKGWSKVACADFKIDAKTLRKLMRE